MKTKIILFVLCVLVLMLASCATNKYVTEVLSEFQEANKADPIPEHVWNPAPIRIEDYDCGDNVTIHFNS